jgi:hypothetical protein
LLLGDLHVITEGVFWFLGSFFLALRLFLIVIFFFKHRAADQSVSGCVGLSFLMLRFDQAGRDHRDVFLG